ncbi:prisilkin-39 [Drosophila biarmipes]|uniref:prisilkin-39 n=1 Tax=Drosophila biarmipes TaxID=125945 RepID=UPI0007E75760|nr:prisilkin-39 [Drosophila biarmipes]
MDRQQLIVGFHSVHTQLPILSRTKHNLSQNIIKMNSMTILAILAASLAVCAGDVSHLPRSYLPPLSGGYSSGYSSYPSYSSGSGYYSGGGSYASPIVASSYKSYAVPQYTTYAAPSRTYLPADTGYTGYSGYSGYSGYNGLDTKYGSNGGYVY